MRTTLTIDEDLRVAIERRRRALGHTFKQEVNDLLRAGLLHLEGEHDEDRQVRIEPLAVGRPLLRSFDDIAAVIALSEGEGHR
ncbi:MAG TPA: hypothetical protein VKU89_08690 [Solirubrobacteraceae bacterium]|nr:hypothetical protein [Solirubrobacteraceae bacterium]